MLINFVSSIPVITSPPPPPQVVDLGSWHVRIINLWMCFILHCRIFCHWEYVVLRPVAGSGGTMMDLLAVEFSVCRCTGTVLSFVCFMNAYIFLGAAIPKTPFRIEYRLADLVSAISYHLISSEFICSSVQFIQDLVFRVYLFKDDCTLPL